MMAGPSLGKVLAVAAIGAVIATIIVALALIEGPWTMRALRVDARRAGDLNDLANALNCYWTLEGEQSLPADLKTLVRRLDVASKEQALPAICRPPSIADPETGEPYGYRVLGGAEFEFCATFAHASDPDAPGVTGRYPWYGRREWRHEAGEHCFRLTAQEIKLPGITKSD